MLVRAFQIQIDRRVDLGTRGPDAFEREAGVGPHVHHVFHLLVVVRFRAEQLGRLQREPRFDAALLHALSHCQQQLLRTRMQLARDLVNEQRDRHAPGALTRDAPVRPILDHAGDALFAPRGRPAELS